MKKTVLRIGMALVLLGALAAIPASTQVVTPASQTTSKQTGTSLPMLLLVNRLELSRTQMETLRTTVQGLLDEQAVFESRRADFTNEMIAFHGTAEELDARISAYSETMAAARSSLRSKVVAAVDTLKETLTMKQGEVLMRAYPGLFDRLDAATARGAAAIAPSSVTKSANAAASKGTVAAALRGRVVITKEKGTVTIATPGAQASPSESAPVGSMGSTALPNGTAGSGISDKAAAVKTKIGALVDRVHDRLASRLGTAPDSAAADLAASAEETPSDFGTLTLSLRASGASGSIAQGAGAPRAVAWLKNLLDVLDLKLAAIP